MNASIKYDHNTNGSLVKDTAYKVYYFDIITTFKNVEEIVFKEKEDQEDALCRALCKFEDRDIKDEKLIKNSNITVVFIKRY
jgi:CRISPR-associated endonuclease Csn1